MLFTSIVLGESQPDVSACPYFRRRAVCFHVDIGTRRGALAELGHDNGAAIQDGGCRCSRWASCVVIRSSMSTPATASNKRMQVLPARSSACPADVPAEHVAGGAVQVAAAAVVPAGSGGRRIIQRRNNDQDHGQVTGPSAAGRSWPAAATARLHNGTATVGREPGIFAVPLVVVRMWGQVHTGVLQLSESRGSRGLGLLISGILVGY
jgi:hypothetical protein